MRIVGTIRHDHATGPRAPQLALFRVLDADRLSSVVTQPGSRRSLEAPERSVLRPLESGWATLAWLTSLSEISGKKGWVSRPPCLVSGSPLTHGRRCRPPFALRAAASPQRSATVPCSGVREHERKSSRRTGLQGSRHTLVHRARRLSTACRRFSPAFAAVFPGEKPQDPARISKN